MRLILLILTLIPAITLASELSDIESLEKEIESALKLGQSKHEVEAFLGSTTWLYDYDRFQNRYQARPIDGTAECKGRSFLLWLLYECGIQIYLNFDKSGSYTGYSVEQVYSGL